MATDAEAKALINEVAIWPNGLEGAALERYGALLMKQLVAALQERMDADNG